MFRNGFPEQGANLAEIHQSVQRVSFYFSVSLFRHADCWFNNWRKPLYSTRFSHSSRFSLGNMNSSSWNSPLPLIIIIILVVLAVAPRGDRVGQSEIPIEGQIWSRGQFSARVGESRVAQEFFRLLATPQRRKIFYSYLHR